MPGVLSAQETSALVNTRGVRPARSSIVSNSIPNWNLPRGTNILASDVCEVEDCGTLEKWQVPFELRALAEFSAGDEFLPTTGGSDEGRATVNTSEADDG
jgi:hypothetical protein